MKRSKGPFVPLPRPCGVASCPKPSYRLMQEIQPGAIAMANLRPVSIHISKNTGTRLAEAAGDAIVNAGHRTAARWVAEHGAAATLFAAVRNPFDRVVLEYHFRRRRFKSGEANPHLANLHLPFTQWEIDAYRHDDYRTRAFFDCMGVPFNERNMIDDTLLLFLPQVAWLAAGDGTLLVGDLLRFENLAADWNAFADRHGILGRLHRRNVSPRDAGNRMYYDAETRALIAEYFSDDLAAFGYEF